MWLTEEEEEEEDNSNNNNNKTTRNTQADSHDKIRINSLLGYSSNLPNRHYFNTKHYDTVHMFNITHCAHCGQQWTVPNTIVP